MQQLIRKSYWNLKNSAAYYQGLFSYVPKKYFSINEDDDFEESLKKQIKKDKKPFEDTAFKTTGSKGDSQKPEKKFQFETADGAAFKMKQSGFISSQDGDDIFDQILKQDLKGHKIMNKSAASLQKRFKFRSAEEGEDDQEVKPQEIDNNEIRTGLENQGHVARFYRLKQLREARNSRGKIDTELKDIEKQNFKKVDLMVYTREGEYHHPKNARVKKEIDKLKEVQEQNKNLVREYHTGEEGFDTMTINPQNWLAVPNVLKQLQREAENLMVAYGTEGERASIETYRKDMLLRMAKGEDFRIEKAGTKDETKFYPGSSKGPHPMDDPVHFTDWYWNSLDQNQKEAFRQADHHELNMEENDFKQMTSKSSQLQMGLQNLILCEVPMKHMTHYRPEDKFYGGTPFGMVYYSNFSDATIPPVPEDEYPDPEVHQEQVEKYLLFRHYPEMINLNNNIMRLMREQRSLAADANGFKRSSVMGYYNLLPDFMRNAFVIRFAVRQLEHHTPGANVKEKEALLNYCLQFLMEQPRYIIDAMNEGIQARIQPITQFEYSLFYPRTQAAESEPEKKAQREREFAIIQSELDNTSSQVDTEDYGTSEHHREPNFQIDPFFDEDAFPFEKYKNYEEDEFLKYEELEQPERHTDLMKARDPQANLPIDFFDNSDGYYDRYLNWKDSQYDANPIQIVNRIIKH